MFVVKYVSEDVVMKSAYRLTYALVIAGDMFDEIYENIERSNEKIDLMIKDVEKVDDVAGNVAQYK